MKVAVVTPTIGADCLSQCVESVQNQTYENLTHYIYLDGEQHYDKIYPILGKYSGRRTIKTTALEENVGKGWYGHRVYAACSYLVNADVICYLDEDNWFDENHVEKLIDTIQKGNDWAFSLRKIYDKDGTFLCEDNCESLGKWPAYFNDGVYHIDTSSFAVTHNCATRIGHAWYGQWGADRQFFHNLKHHFPKFDCTGLHSLCYRLDGNDNSVSKGFFDKGNAVSEQKYPNGFPWKESPATKIGVGPGITLIA